MNLNASLLLLAVIGEGVSKISKELKQKYQNIEWQQIKNFRNRVAHNYTGVDLAIVYKIINSELKTLKKEIIKIVKEGIEQKIFDIEELKIAKESKYYKYINFEEII